MSFKFYLYQILLVLPLLIFGCKDDPIIPGKPVVLADSIVHTAPDTFLRVTCVRYMQYVSYCNCYYPMPDDSTAHLRLDVDNDGEDDFDIECSNWYKFVSASNPGANKNSLIEIDGLNGNSVMATGQYGIVQLLQERDSVHLQRDWRRYAYLKLSSVHAQFSTDYNGLFYYGIRLKKGNDYYFGWLLVNKSDYVVEVREYAINLTPNNSILAGQKE